jgi:HAD superfamily hydrolase (TIGR01484 family)
MSLENPWLLAADMDGTVIPLEDSPSHRRAVASFRSAVESRPDLLLAYVTGRDLNRAQRGIREWGLPMPDILATDVGTAVHRWNGNEFQPDPEYAHLMREAMGGISPDEIRERLAEDPALEPQEPDRQGPHKVSFYVALDEAGPILMDRLRRQLEGSGARVNLVYSVDGVAGVGLLDILPQGVAKDSAVRFLHDRTGVAKERLLYAGDSGNDEAAMVAGYRVIVVGNAPESLKDRLRQRAGIGDVDDRLYFARAPYAAGVLEGLGHWGVLSGV